MSGDLFSYAEAREARNRGMAQAVEHADWTHPEWSEIAYRFLVEFARRNVEFISEDVSGASKVFGMEQPPTDRAWGSVYRRAVKAGIMEQCGIGRSARRHASICPRWRSLVFQGRSA